jgi:hypothetical protein
MHPSRQCNGHASHIDYFPPSNSTSEYQKASHCRVSPDPWNENKKILPVGLAPPIGHHHDAQYRSYIVVLFISRKNFNRSLKSDFLQTKNLAAEDQLQNRERQAVGTCGSKSTEIDAQ